MVGEDRQGAPASVDFDTLAGVQSWASLMLPAATGPDADMPPVGGPTPEDRERLAEWLACGAPGTPLAEPAGCDGTTVDGDLVVDDVPPSDLCAVTGTLDIRGSGAVVLPDLAAVGALRIVGAAATSVHLPALAGSTASVTVGDNPALEVLDLGGLAVIDGDLRITDDGLGGAFAPDWLATVGGDVELSGLPRLTTVELWRLAAIGGDLEVADAPALFRIAGTESLRSIGGDLTITSAGVGAVAGFTNLEAVGRITLRDLPAAAHLDAFTWLPGAGALTIADMAELRSTRGFHNLARVDGPLVLSGSPLGVIDGFRELAHVGGLEVRDAQAITLAVLDELRTVDGDLVLAGNPGLDVVTGLHGVEHVAGDLVVVDNPRLSPFEVEALVRAIDAVDGEVVRD